MRMRHHCGTGRPLPPWHHAQDTPGQHDRVSMHLMVLGAPWRALRREYAMPPDPCLNAPDGAGCSLTARLYDRLRRYEWVSMHPMALDAPLARSSRLRTQGTEIRNTTPHTTA